MTDPKFSGRDDDASPCILNFVPKYMQQEMHEYNGNLLSFNDDCLLTPYI